MPAECPDGPLKSESPKVRFRYPLGLLAFDWSGRRDLNPRPFAWQANALPLSYSRAPCDTGAGGEIRTLTGLRPPAPKADASAVPPRPLGNRVVAVYRAARCLARTWRAGARLGMVPAGRTGPAPYPPGITSLAVRPRTASDLGIPRDKTRLHPPLQAGDPGLRSIRGGGDPHIDRVQTPVHRVPAGVSPSQTSVRYAHVRGQRLQVDVDGAQLGVDPVQPGIHSVQSGTPRHQFGLHRTQPGAQVTRASRERMSIRAAAGRRAAAGSTRPRRVVPGDRPDRWRPPRRLPSLR